MKLALAILAVFMVAARPATAQIERPRLGYVLDSRGDLRPVIGEPASAILGGPVGNPASVQPAGGDRAGDLIGDRAISFACSSQLCVVKTDAAVVAFAPERPAGGRTAAASRSPALRSIAALPCAACSGPALIALDDFGRDTPGAWIYFQAARQLARWHNGTLDTAEFAPSGQILSLRATTGGFDYAVARGRPGRSAGVVWIEHYSASDGHITVIDSFRSASAAMLFDGGTLLSSRNDVILRRPDGQEMTFPLAGPKRFHAAGDGYVEIAVPEGLWLLRTDPGREQLFLLPGQAD